MISRNKMILLWFIFGFLLLSESRNTFFPNLPVGEYRVIYEAIYPCQHSENNTMEFNVYFSKKSKNLTEVKGNFTFRVPFDDDLVLEASVSSWSLRGGWVKNAYHQKANNLCTSAKMLSGKAWYSLIEAFHVPTKNCPIPKGTYTTSGFDIRIVDDNNLPKVFFYGKYKIEYIMKLKNNNLIGCVALEVRLVRPWELPTF